MRLRRRSGFARPYICLLIILTRLTLPSTAPELLGRVRPFVTAAQSLRSPAAKLRSAPTRDHEIWARAQKVSVGGHVFSVCGQSGSRPAASLSLTVSTG
jgi:hypothetical protein